MNQFKEGKDDFFNHITFVTDVYTQYLQHNTYQFIVSLNVNTRNNKVKEQYENNRYSDLRIK